MTGTEDAEKALANKIVEAVEKYWNDEESPYLLSQLAPSLGDYRDIITPQTLKQYISTLSDRVTVVQHSSKKAMVGVIPASKNYSFDQPAKLSPAVAESSERKVRAPTR